MQAEILGIDGQEQDQGAGRRRHAHEIIALPGREVGPVERHVEAREPERRADREHEHGDPAQAVQILERPVEHDDGRRHAEIDEVGEAVELGAESARRP